MPPTGIRSQAAAAAINLTAAGTTSVRTKAPRCWFHRQRLRSRRPGWLLLTLQLLLRVLQLLHLLLVLLGLPPLLPVFSHN
jgi:hypothetical protein